jgi:hypothetical protein
MEFYTLKKYLKMVKPILLNIVCVLGTVCCASKKTAYNTTVKSDLNTHKQTELISKEFTFGTIEESTEQGDCLYTIRMGENKKDSYYFDPINLKEPYKKNGLEVFFTYRGLRIMNRCVKANPIEVEEMKLN